MWLGSNEPVRLCRWLLPVISSWHLGLGVELVQRVGLPGRDHMMVELGNLMTVGRG